MLSHFDDSGASRMVNVGDKPVTGRFARAAGILTLQAETLHAIQNRKTADLIPLCHPLGLESVEINFAFPDETTIRIESRVNVSAKTGVEMEAMTAVCVAALTIYDMCKAVDRTISIGPMQLLEKSGGRSGHFIIE